MRALRGLLLVVLATAMFALPACRDDSGGGGDAGTDTDTDSDMDTDTERLFGRACSGTTIVMLSGRVTRDAAPARRPKNGKRGGERDGIGRMTEELNLTADQQGKIGKLRAAMTAQAKPIEQKLRDLKAQERAAWTSAKPDEAKVIALHRESMALEGGLDELRIAQRFDVWEQLTPAQRAEFAKL